MGNPCRCLSAVTFQASDGALAAAHKPRRLRCNDDVPAILAGDLSPSRRKLLSTAYRFLFLFLQFLADSCSYLENHAAIPT